MDAQALGSKYVFKGEMPWEDNMCDPWISNWETISEQSGALVCFIRWSFCELVIDSKDSIKKNILFY